MGVGYGDDIASKAGVAIGAVTGVEGEDEAAEGTNSRVQAVALVTEGVGARFECLLSTMPSAGTPHDHDTHLSIV